MAIAEFACFCANSAIATFALVAKLCKFHICNIFAQGKFDANSFFRPVILSREKGISGGGPMVVVVGGWWWIVVDEWWWMVVDEWWWIVVDEWCCWWIVVVDSRRPAERGGGGGQFAPGPNQRRVPKTKK